MKIIDARVKDPRRRGVYSDPHVEVFVDEPVNEIDRARKVHQHFRLVPCGPFFSIEEWSITKSDWTDEGVDTGTFNVLGLHREQLIDIVVIDPEAEHHLQMPVQRVSRLLRKHDPLWIVKVDREAALKGRLSWIIESVDLECFGGVCTGEVVETVLHNGTHVPLCEHHRTEHARKIRDMRVTSLR